MPKTKTHQGVASRFRVTKGGKLVRRQSHLNHNLGKKSSVRKRRLARNAGVSRGDRRTIGRLLGR